jgi:hypothetical protein
LGALSGPLFFGENKMTNCSGPWHWQMEHSWLGHMGDHTYRKSVEVFENSDDLYKIVIQNLTEKEHQIYLDKLDEAKVECENDE